MMSAQTLIVSSNHIAAMEVSLECPVVEALFGRAMAHPVSLTQLVDSGLRSMYPTGMLSCN